MGYELSRIGQKPIWVAKFTDTDEAPYNPVEHAQAIQKELYAETAEVDGLIYYVSDYREISIKFTDLVAGLAEVFKPNVKTFFTEENVRIVTVGTQELVRLASQAASQEQYGGIEIQIYGDIDSAVQYIDGELAKSS